VSVGWDIVLFLHLVAMAFFVGGQLLIGVAVPALRRDPEVLRAVARRFGYGSLAALAVLAVTGAALASHEGLWDSSTLQLKIGLVGLLAVLAVAHLRYPRAHILQAAILIVTLAVVWLGIRVAT
jgi:putative copper export protein